MKLRHKCVAEFIGTFALVFAGCGAVMVAERFPESIPPFVIPVVFGLVVMAVIHGIGHISGAHINPAVTLAFAIARHFPRKEILPYWASQFLGGIAAIGMLTAMLPSGAEFGATVPHLGPAQSFLWEVSLTFLLMFVVTGVATDTRAEGPMAGAAIGATVMLCAFFGGPVTGASMNPARSFGPALFQGTLDSFWIYLIAPCVGAIIAALSYKFVRCGENNKEVKGCC